MMCGGYILLIFLSYVGGVFIEEFFGVKHPYMISFFTILILYFFFKAIFGGKARPTVHARRYQNFDFLENLLILSADVIKADGHFRRSELDYLRNFFSQNLGPVQAQLALNRLREILQENHNTVYVCETIRSNTTIHERLLVLQFLFGLADADGTLHPDEISRIEKISILLGISRSDYESVKAMFMGGAYSRGSYSSSNGSSGYRSHSIENDYKILEISPDATDEEVKKAYRAMAKKYHPDRVAHLGEEMRKQAEEKFARMTDAYDRIKKSRGM